MRVVYIGNFEPPHSTENDMRSAMERTGHTVHPVQEQHIDWAALSREIAQDPPNLVLWTRTGSLDKTDPEAQRRALRAIRDHAPVAGFHLDLFWGLKARNDRERWVRELPYFQETDIMFSADGGHSTEWADAGVTHYWLPPGIAGHNTELEGQPQPKFKAEVGFVGNWRDYHPEWRHRRQLVTWVQRVYRNRFRYWEGHIRGQDLADLYATVSVLIGDSCLLGPYYWSDRIPETLGRGGFLLHPDTPGLRDWFPDHTLVTWPLGDFRELRYLIDYYLKHPTERRFIAEAGRLHVAEHHTYERRFAQLCEVLALA